jgi:glycerol uptake facilitator-like aquaporin
MSKLKGILYLICQLVGTIIGSVIGFAVTNNNSPAIILLQAKLYNTDSGPLFFESFINAFLFCVIFLILISREITFVEL